MGPKLQRRRSITGQSPARPRGGSDHHRDETAAVTQDAGLEPMAVDDSHPSEPVRARGNSAADDSHPVQARADNHPVQARVDTPEQFPAANTRAHPSDVVAAGTPPSDHHHTQERADTPAAVEPPPFLLLRTQERADIPAEAGPPPFLLRTQERADTLAVPFHRDTPVRRSWPAPSALGNTYHP